MTTTSFAQTQFAIVSSIKKKRKLGNIVQFLLE